MQTQVTSHLVKERAEEDSRKVARGNLGLPSDLGSSPEPLQKWLNFSVGLKGKMHEGHLGGSVV